MRTFLLLLLVFLPGDFAFAQKPPLDFRALTEWPVLGTFKISSDGQYILYNISKKSGSTLKLNICSTDKTFHHELSGVWDGNFSEDSRYLVFIRPGDSLSMIDLHSRKETVIPGVESFRMPEEGRGQWLACLLKTKELLLYDLFSSERKPYPAVSDYVFAKNGQVLLINSKLTRGSTKINTLQWLDLSSGREKTIWKGKSADNFVFDNTGKRLAFITQSDSGQPIENKVWYYEAGMDSARLLIDQQTAGVPQGFTAGNEELKFSPSGKKLFFNLISNRTATKDSIPKSAVDVWHYKDDYLQTEQLMKLVWNANPSFKTVINLDNKKIIRLQRDNDVLQFSEGGDDDYLLAESNVNGAFKPLDKQPDLFIINTNDGSRKLVKRHLESWSTPTFSPGGRYILWYAPEKKSYFTYNIGNGQVKNISSNGATRFYDVQTDRGEFPSFYGPAVWLQDDQALLVYDCYDIWQLDPSGIKAAINLSNGYGRKNKVVFRCIYPNGGNFYNAPPVVANQAMLLCGFNEVTKDNGFFIKMPHKPANPVLLTMSSNLFYFSSGLPGTETPNILSKAKNAEVFLLTRQSATDFPNLVITKNFKHFTPITDLAPQKAYNSLTTELVRWQTFDGHPGEGILYKPEDFNPQKRYPVIFYFYETLSDGLNKFTDPGLSVGPVNIPWFVSHGYLVFVPDIRYTIGKPGESAYNYVVSAAKMMSEKPYVNPKCLGIQGHSWGGYETNYLVAHSHLFAAAASASGLSDLVSMYGSLSGGRDDLHGMVELGQVRMGVTLWQDRARYIRESPLFDADRVTTPLLIMQNKGDGNVPWSQGVEFFTALRRLGKKAWMLQYDNGNHTLTDEKDKLDYTIRLQQFFDHYLKGTPPPIWMTEGIPAKDKGYKTGLELDTSGKQP